MNAKEYFKDQCCFSDSEMFSDIFNGTDMIEFAKKYHQAKSKEEAKCKHQWQEVHKANNHQSSWGANRCMICGEIDEWQYDF